MPPRPLEIRKRPAAEDDLIEIWIYTAQQWGRDQADFYLDELEASFRKLSENPRISPECPEIRPGYRKHASGQHRIYYRVETAFVEIVRVIHAGRDAKARLEE